MEAAVDYVLEVGTENDDSVWVLLLLLLLYTRKLSLLGVNNQMHVRPADSHVLPCTHVEANSSVSLELDHTLLW